MRPRDTTTSLLLLLSLFVWAGMVLGISFLEAPLKFTAPHITVPLGLGIGRIVFQALNKVELVLATMTVLCAWRLQVPSHIAATLGLLSAILLLQTFWLLPALDARALALLAGNPAPPNSMHTTYIGLEVLKVITLLLTGTWAYRWVLYQTATSTHSLRHERQLA